MEKNIFLPLEGFFVKIGTWNFFENLTRKLLESSKNKVYFMKTYVNLWLHHSELFFEWEIFQTTL